jgi:Kef-type K+ transport system membrane component KefB
MKKAINKIKDKTKTYGRMLILALAVLLFISVIRQSIFSDVPEEKKIWFEISFILLLAVSAELLVSYLKQPMVMILLVFGIIISPSAISVVSPYLSAALVSFFSIIGLKVSVADTLPHLVPSEGFIKIFAQLGSIFLLFKVGLHSEIGKIFNARNFFVALLGVIVPFLAGYYYATLTGGGFIYAMFLGAALTATSVGVTVAVLEEFGVMHREFAKIILGAAVIDDILSLLVLSLVENFPSEFTVQTLAPFAWIIAVAAVYVIGGIRLGQYIVSKFFDKISSEERIDNATFLSMLAYLLAYAYVAEFIGLSAIVGAFIAGVTLNYSRSVHKIFDLFYPLEAFFTPIFFISLGMLVDVIALSENLYLIGIVTLIAVATKIVGCGFAAKVTGGSLKDSLIVGVGMVPRGEVALIIGLIGITATTSTGETILSSREYAVIASMAFLTTVIIPFMLQKVLHYGGYSTKTG